MHFLVRYSLLIYTLMTLALWLAPTHLLAMDSPEVLPMGIRNIEIRSGVMSGIGQRYNHIGQLQTLNDIYSLEFDVQRLVQVAPEAQELVDALNQFGNQELGDALHLGVLRLDTEPRIKYLAPIFAYGINDRWTLGFGVPVINYQNKISMAQTGSNAADIQARVGNASPRLQDALNRLNVSLVAQANAEIQRKGYAAIQDKDQTFLGDILLVSAYKLYTSNLVNSLLQTSLNLPTGPKDDADDLTALNSFHRTSLEQQALLTFNPPGHPWHRIRLGAKASYRWTFADKADRRVPVNADDTLPAADRKENLNRQIGSEIATGVSSTVNFWRMNAGVGYEWIKHSADRYYGERSYDYTLVSPNSESSAQRVRFNLQYDSTSAFLRQESLAPYLITYEFSDTVRGSNIERRTLHEVRFALFF